LTLTKKKKKKKKLGDPHPGNVLVRKSPKKKNQVEVVMIDHGLYIQESEK
jgi:aarF domain-containing kinase